MDRVLILSQRVPLVALLHSSQHSLAHPIGHIAIFIINSARKQKNCTRRTKIKLQNSSVREFSLFLLSDNRNCNYICSLTFWLSLFNMYSNNHQHHHFASLLKMRFLSEWMEIALIIKIECNQKANYGTTFLAAHEMKGGKKIEMCGKKCLGSRKKVQGMDAFS
jgi:hypothetical protein